MYNPFTSQAHMNDSIVNPVFIQIYNVQRLDLQWPHSLILVRLIKVCIQSLLYTLSWAKSNWQGTDSGHRACSIFKMHKVHDCWPPKVCTHDNPTRRLCRYYISLYVQSTWTSLEHSSPCYLMIECSFSVQLKWNDYALLMMKIGIS